MPFLAVVYIILGQPLLTKFNTKRGNIDKRNILEIHKMLEMTAFSIQTRSSLPHHILKNFLWHINIKGLYDYRSFRFQIFNRGQIHWEGVSFHVAQKKKLQGDKLGLWTSKDSKQ